MGLKTMAMVETMPEDDENQAEESTVWQSRYITPILLVVGTILVTGSWAVDAVPSWVTVVLLAFGVVTLAIVASKMPTKD